MIDMIRLQKHSKRDLKNSKIIQKQLQELHRQAQAMNRKPEERNNNTDSDDENDYFDRKAKKWWARFDERNFALLTPSDSSRIRDITTSDRILQQMPKQAVTLLPYSKEKLVPEYDLFAEESLIHVLFKTKNPSFRCLASYELEQAIPSYSQNNGMGDEIRVFKVTPSATDIDLQIPDLKQVKLCLVGYNEDKNVCRSVKEYKKAKEKFCDRFQIEKQLYLWQKQLSSINKQNNLVWDKLAKQVKSQAFEDDNSQEITKIKLYLLWATILKYFENGYQDKTEEQLNQLIQAEKAFKPIKSKDAAATKKFFETDCKICFCSYNYDSNQVLYCDSCNTSFHLACYGLQEIPKEEKYYCDCCRFMRRQNSKKLFCQLCNKANFPIKQINGHFYHVTCLMLFNLVRINKGFLALKEGLSHFKIMQMVIESELNQRECEFCSNPGNETGIRTECSFKNCKNSAHPICAYINGCQFQVKRSQNSQSIKVNYQCNMHNTQRDWIKQTYLRRYMCNLRNTSELKQKEFRVQYSVQIMKRTQEQLKSNWTWNPYKIIAKTRFIKKRLAQDQSKQMEQYKFVETQTSKMLEKLKKKKN